MKNKINEKINELLKKTSNVGGDIYVWIGGHAKKASASTIETANEIWRKTTDIGKGATSNTIDISNKIWKKTVDAGPILQQVIIESYKIATSPQTKEILGECQEIAVIVTRISTTILTDDAINIIKKRTNQGITLGSSYIPGPGTIIGATVGAALGLCEVAYKLQKNPQFQKDIKDLYKRCINLVEDIKKTYNADMSPLATGTEQLSFTPQPVSAHPFVENPRPITFGKRPVIPGYDD